jgi:hypothetical protein
MTQLDAPPLLFEVNLNGANLGALVRIHDDSSEASADDAPRESKSDLLPKVHHTTIYDIATQTSAMSSFRRRET